MTSILIAFLWMSLPTPPVIGGHDFFSDLIRNGSIWWLFSAAIRTMPDPSVVNNIWYTWLSGLLHLVAANFDRIHGAGTNNNPLK